MYLLLTSFLRGLGRDPVVAFCLVRVFENTALEFPAIPTHERRRRAIKKLKRGRLLTCSLNNTARRCTARYKGRFRWRRLNTEIGLAEGDQPSFAVCDSFPTSSRTSHHQSACLAIANRLAGRGVFPVNRSVSSSKSSTYSKALVNKRREQTWLTHHDPKFLPCFLKMPLSSTFAVQSVVRKSSGRLP